MKRPNKKSAFTLLELLIATAISVVIITGVYSAFHTGILSYRKIESTFLPYQSARNILGSMEKELRNAFSYRTDDAGFQGQQNSLGFFSVLDTFEEGEQVTDAYRIKYAAGNSALERAVYPATGGLQNEDEASGRRSVYKIKDIVFEYAAATGGPDKDYTWQALWPKDDSQKNIFPLAVRIKLSLFAQDAPGGSIDFTRIVGFPLS